jgi:hypothetical protein
MKKLILLLPILLMACTAKPETPAQSVFLAESDYAAGLKIELAYSNLPRCPKAKLCSDVSIIKKVQIADNVAYVALKDAQAAVRTPGYGDSKITTVVASATALTKAFVDITQTLGVK